MPHRVLIGCVVVLGLFLAQLLIAGDVERMTSGGQIVGGVHKTTPATLTDGQTDGLHLNTTGALHVSIRENIAGATAQTVSLTSSTLTIGKVDQGSGAAVTAPWAERLTDGTSFYVAAKTGQLPSVLGQAAMAGSTSVVVASDQSSLPTTEARLPAALTAGGGVKTGLVDALPTGANTIGDVTVSEIPAAAALADATANPTTPLLASALELFNGTTWDRVRGDTTNGLDVDVTRLSALVAGSAVIGKVGIDQTTPGTTNLVQIGAGTSNIGDVDVLTIAAGDNNIGNVDIVSMPADATELPAAAVAADGAANPTAPFVVAAMSGWNGTTWDRLKSDTSNGLDVDVTRLPALVAGSALIGKVGIDQTTPGTTNGVALTAGTSIAGAFRPVASSQRTYSSTFNVVAAGAGVAVEILGPSSGSGEIIEIFLTKPSVQVTVTLNKRSTAATGGTAVARDEVPHDAADAAATAQVIQYTAVPTAGTLVGEVRRATLGTTDTTVFTFADQDGKPFTLNAATQALTIDVSAAVTLVGHVVVVER